MFIFLCSQNASRAVSSLLALVINALELPLVLEAVSIEAVLNSIEQFLVCPPSEVRVLVLVAISKMCTCVDDEARIHEQMCVVEEDIKFFVHFITDQHGLPVSSELFQTALLTLASASGQNRKVFTKSNVTQMLQSLPQSTPNLESFQHKLAKCLSPGHFEAVPGGLTEVVLPTSHGQHHVSECKDVPQSIIASSAIAESLPRLIPQAKQFKNVLLEEQVTNRDPFVALADLLADVEESLMAFHKASAEPEVFQRLSCTLVGNLCELLPGEK